MRYSAGKTSSNKGTNSRMASTAINDIWNPTSNNQAGFHISMTIAVKARAFTDILSRLPIERRP
jgi:hypothetical protein